MAGGVSARCAFLRAKLSQFVEQQRRAPAVEKTGQIIKVGYLANPKTLLRISASNAITAGVRTFVTQPVAAALDYIAAVGRSAATRFEAPPRAFREVNVPSVAGIRFGAAGFRESLAKGIDVMRTGVDPDHLSEQFDARRINYGSPAFNRAINGFFDFVGAAHSVWYGFAYNTSLFNSAEVLAIKEGLTGAARRARVDELLAHPTDEMQMRALEDAQYAAFRNRTALGDATTRFKGSLRTMGESAAERERTPTLAASKRITGKTLYLGTEMFLPFVQMPVAGLGVALDHSPVGFAKAALSLLEPELRNQRQIAMQLARAGVGTVATFGLGYALAKKGLMTGGLPTSPGERAAWDAEGKVPYAIKVKGRWYSVRAGEPVVAPAVLGADLWQQHAMHPDEDVAGQAGDVVAFTGKQLAELPMLMGLQTINDALSDPAHKGKALAVAAVPIPSIVNQTAQALDPTVRQANTVGQKLEAKIPGLSRSLPPRLDQFGRPIQRANGSPLVQGLGAMLDISQSRTDQSDPVTRELDRLKVSPGLPGKTVRIEKHPVTMTAAEYNAVLRELGPRTHEYLQSLIRDPWYQSLSDEDRATVLKRTITNLRTLARAQYKGQKIGGRPVTSITIPPPDQP